MRIIGFRVQISEFRGRAIRHALCSLSNAASSLLSATIDYYRHLSTSWCKHFPKLAHSCTRAFDHFPTFHILLSTILLIAALQSASAQGTADRFLWDQANTQITHASKPEDHLKAASTYQRLLKNDIVNPALLNNLGCALTMGGDYKNAISAFERAERYSGTTVESTAGIAAATARRDKSESAELPWYRTAFFWHFSFPARLRIITALSGWSLLWTGILLYIIRRRKREDSFTIFLTLSETCMVTGALIFILFGSSSLFTLLQERQSNLYWRTAEFSTMQNMEEEL